MWLRAGRREVQTICELWQAPAAAAAALGRMLQLKTILNSLKQLRAAEWGPCRPLPGMESPEILADPCLAVGGGDQASALKYTISTLKRGFAGWE